MPLDRPSTLLLAAFLTIVAVTTATARPVTCDPIPNYHSATYTRNSTALTEFKRATGFPLGRPGWQIDHMRPLKCGGGDCPANMEWMPVEQKKLKDAWELDCSRYVPVAPTP